MSETKKPNKFVQVDFIRESDFHYNHTIVHETKERMALEIGKMIIDKYGVFDVKKSENMNGQNVRLIVDLTQ